MDENGSSDLVLFQNALAEFESGYEHPFTMETCRRILKNHEAWTEVEMPSFNQRQNDQKQSPNIREATHDSHFFISTIEKSADDHEICDEYLTEKEQQQLLFDEEALRETLEEEARKKQAHDELFMLEFGVKSNS
nr:hypothetical protein [Tanacetum cinerariifolium]